MVAKKGNNRKRKRWAHVNNSLQWILVFPFHTTRSAANSLGAAKRMHRFVAFGERKKNECKTWISACNGEPFNAITSGEKNVFRFVSISIKRKPRYSMLSARVFREKFAFARRCLRAKTLTLTLPIPFPARNFCRRTDWYSTETGIDVAVIIPFLAVTPQRDSSLFRLTNSMRICHAIARVPSTPPATAEARSIVVISQCDARNVERNLRASLPFELNGKSFTNYEH